MQHPGGYAGDVRRPDGLEQEVLGAFFHATAEKMDRNSDRHRGSRQFLFIRKKVT